MKYTYDDHWFITNERTNKKHQKQTNNIFGKNMRMVFKSDDG